MTYNEFLQGKRISMECSGFDITESDINPQLFDFQRDIVRWAVKKGKSAVFAGTGLGKCMGFDTPVLMHNGTVKPIQEIVVGDLLLGPDSKPRVVKSTTCGYGDMFRVTPIKGDPFVCNDVHVLSLKCTADKNQNYKKNMVVNIQLNEYLNKNKTFKHMMKLWRTGVSFEDTCLDIDPYFIGVWIGDGSYEQPVITKTEKETELCEYFREFATEYDTGLTISPYPSHNTSYWRFTKGANGGNETWILKRIRELCINGEKRIPAKYLITSSKNRLALLAGLVDSDGHLIDNVYEIVTKSKGLSEDILFLARSLGFAAYCSKTTKTIKSLGFEGEYYRIFISGDTGLIPVKLERKRAAKRRQIKDVLKTGFSVDYMGQDGYYGFELSGDGLYLLGDFTVTHNTAMQLEWARHIHNRDNKQVLILAPLAVATQTVKEGAKFGIDVTLCRSQEDVRTGINITNYDMLHKFEPSAFDGIVLDESSILKSFTGKVRNQIIESFAETPYKLACTATPAPNDHMELGNHAEFLGVMNRSEMLAMFFVHDGGNTSQWRLKGHSVSAFWQWVSSWAVMLTNPSDLGYENNGFDLLPLSVNPVVVDKTGYRVKEAQTLTERRDARRNSLDKRVAAAVDLVADSHENWIIWCDLNSESEAITKAIDGAVEITGSHDREYKTKTMTAFANGEIDILVTKAKIAGFGMNFQVCHNMAFVGLSDCYDSETEILTQDGWKTFDLVTMDDKIATVNQETLMFEWEQPIRVVWESYEGDMYHFVGQRNFDLMVTPNHKLFVSKDANRYPTSDGSWNLEYAQDIVDGYKKMNRRMLSVSNGFYNQVPTDVIKIPIPSGMRISSRSRIVEEVSIKDMVELAGWYVSEGHCRPLNSKEAGRIVISQTDLNPKNRIDIINLLKRIGLHVNHKTKDITGYSYNLAAFLIDEFGSGSYNKHLPKWIKNLDSKWLEILRDTMIKGDGCHNNGIPRVYRTVSRELADDFQELCLKTGVRASIRKRYGVNKDYPNNHIYDVSLAWSRTKPYIHTKPEKVHYNGFIGCVEVPNHTVIVRRNGIPVVSGNSFEAYYQAVRRCWRFGQKEPVNVHVITSEAEGAVVKNINRKEADFKAMQRGMISATQEITKQNLSETKREVSEYMTSEAKGQNWTMYLEDNIERTRVMEDESVDFIMYSPPFSSLYTYSDSDRDMGNCKTDDEFFKHFGFLAPELFRALKSGRLMSVHCMNIPTTLTKDGYIGIKDFRGDIIRLMQSAGFIYHSEVCIWKDPVVAMQRTHAKGLLHKHLKKDSCVSRMGLPDYVVTFLKPGINQEPVEHTGADFPVDLWQKYASPIWDDIRQGDTLQRTSARDERDERHICPLQFDVIQRCIELWTNPDDLVYDPFAGIGSTLYQAVLMGRRGVGCELKQSYFDQAIKNLMNADRKASAPKQVGFGYFEDVK